MRASDPTKTDLNHQIQSCLAYKVLRDPEDWIAGASCMYLHAFLLGAEIRAACTNMEFPHWRIYGVLEDPDFYRPMVEATGHPKLTIQWAKAIAMTHYSEQDGFNYLCEKALARHFKYGIDTKRIIKPWRTQNQLDVNRKKAEHFWQRFAAKPTMFTGQTASWSLFCFFNGMDVGGEWLQLPEMPHLRLYFDRIMNRSQEAYGSTYAAFRIYSMKTLMDWAGLTPGGANF